MIIPFLYELRQMLDWACTTTTLNLFDWLKMEDIADQLYRNRVKLAMFKRENRGRGNKVWVSTKLLYGLLLLGLLFIVLWSPLLLMTLVNSSNLPNPPLRASMAVQLDTFQALFEMDDVPVGITGADYARLRAFDPTQFVDSYESSDIHRVLLAPESKVLWGISPPSRAGLAAALAADAPLPLVLTFTFERAPASGVVERSVATVTSQLAPNSAAVVALRQAVAGSAAVPLAALVPTFFRLDATSNAAVDALPSVLSTRRSSVVLARLGQPAAGGDWWSLNATSPHLV
jgi:hypothetical protein